MGSVLLKCPKCGHVIFHFDRAELEQNKAKRRSFENLHRNPVLCESCKQLVRKLTEEQVEG